MRTEKKKHWKVRPRFYILLGILIAVILIVLAVFLLGDRDQSTGSQLPDTPDASQTGDSGDNDGTDEPGDSGEPGDSDAPGNTEEPDDVQNPGTTSDSDQTTRPQAPASTDVRTEDDGNLMVLVNKQYAVSRDYYPTDMVDIDGSLSTNQNLKVKREAYDAYLSMLADAKKEGLNFAICSAYRSYALQESLYNNSLAANGKEYTEKMFAYPGQSEHHTGYAIDVTSASMNWGLSQNYTDYPDGAWITAHCSEYGFIIRYPKGKEDITGYMYEPWHIRYVGVDAAKEITKQGITLEEYLGVA
ncbi:MAG: M15 family metallopeptidase [Anaerovoracaceae bacterium]